MNRQKRRFQVIAVGAAALAGFVDAIGFIQLGGFFVSFMSGNSTRLGVGLSALVPAAGMAAVLILAFVAGVTAGSLVGAVRPRSGVAVSALVTLVLASAAILHGLGVTTAAMVLLAFAMGAENTTFARGGEVRIALTYVTGALVHIGHGLARALLGSGPRWSWLPYLFLWLGLVLGAVSGALLYPMLGTTALWMAAGAAALLTGGLTVAGESD